MGCALRRSLDSVTEQIAALPADITRETLQKIMAPGAGRNAVDCALWELEAKASGRRIWEMAWMAAPKPLLTTYTLSLDDPDQIRAEAAKKASGHPSNSGCWFGSRLAHSLEQKA